MTYQSEKPITSKEKLTQAEQETYDLLVPRHRKNALQPKETMKPKGPYETGEIEADLNEVARLEKLFMAEEKKHPETKETHQRAELFEALLAENIESRNWFGDNAETIVPSRFDDIKGGVDLLVEFEIESGFIKHLGLSIDATTHIPSIIKKIDQIEADIQHGHLTTLKYFYSEKPSYAGMLKDIPKVIVGAGFESIRELAGLWLNIEKLRTKKFELEKETGLDHPELPVIHKQIRTLAERLNGHRIQFQILEEIKAQLLYFKKFALEQVNGHADDIAQKYDNALETITQILDTKDEAPSDEDRKKIDDDIAYQTIMGKVS